MAENFRLWALLRTANTRLSMEKKGIINVDFKAEYTQSGPLILMGDFRRRRSQCGSSSAEANLCCPPELAKELIHKLTAESGNAVTCTPTEQGIRIAAAGVSAHGAFPELGVNASGLFINRAGQATSV